MNKILKNTLILTAITLIAGLGLGLVHEITLNPIAQAQEKAKKEAWQAVFPDAKLDEFKETDVDQKAAKQAISDLGVNATIDEVCTVGDTGYVITTTDKDGYGGDIQVSVGIQSDGTVSGYSVLSISETAGLGMKAKDDPLNGYSITTINDTAGLGMKAKEPSFYEQYVGKNPTKFAVSKDGGDGEQIDALSGATITSRAVTGAVNAALGYYQNAFGQGGN